MQGCHDIGGNLDTSSPMYFSYPVFISSLITKLILNYDINDKDKTSSDRNQLISYEKFINQAANPLFAAS